MFHKISTTMSILLTDYELFAKHAVAFINKNRFPECDKEGRFDCKIGDVNYVINGKAYPKVAKDVANNSYEVTLLHQLSKFLKYGDKCLDIGANVGVVTAHMMNLVGKSGEVHSFEPVPEYFECLYKIKQINPEYNLFANKIALGDSSGEQNIYCTKSEGIGVNSFFPDFIDRDQWKGSVKVCLTTLSDYLESKSIDHIDMIKIDVEGWGLPVLRGGVRFFKRTRKKPVIILEVSEQTFHTPGFSLKETYELVTELGYIAYKHNNLKRAVDFRNINNQCDLILLPK